MPTDMAAAMSEAADQAVDRTVPVEAPGAVLRDRVIEALRTVYDPEIPVNIYDLGLVYRCDVDADGKVAVDMTLTAPNCPVAETMPEMVVDAVQAVDGVASADVQLVWEPPWSSELMSESARMALDMW